MSTTSFIPYTVSLWNHLDLNRPNISCSKSRIKENTIKSREFYGEGSIKLSMIHARPRHYCSSLNSDLFRIYTKHVLQMTQNANLKHLSKIQFII